MRMCHECHAQICYEEDEETQECPVCIVMKQVVLNEEQNQDLIARIAELEVKIKRLTK